MENDNAQNISITKFGHPLEFIRLKNVDLGNWPLISQFTYSFAIGAATALACGVGICRLVLRYRRRRYWDLDDTLFSFALCCSVVSSVFNIYCADYFYLVAEASAGAIRYKHPEDIIPSVIRYLQIIDSVTDVQWISIYSVKFCYLMFFNKLTKRVRGIRIWWIVVMVITVPAFIVTCMITLVICSHFEDDILAKCGLEDMYIRARAVNKISGSLDILTDVLIISIPLMLLSKVKINTRRKLTVSAILSLSAAMIVIALIRLFPPSAGVRILDATWYFFWVSFEANIAIIMVSITAFRGIFQSGSTNGSGGGWTPSGFAGFKRSFGSKMGRYFIWRSASDQAEPLPVEMAPKPPPKASTRSEAIGSFYFKWETTHDDFDDSYGMDNCNGEASRAQQKPSARNEDHLVSLPSTAFSPLSSINRSFSPLSTQKDQI